MAEKLSSSREELDIDLYKIVGIFISQIQKKNEVKILKCMIDSKETCKFRSRR